MIDHIKMAGRVRYQPQQFASDIFTALNSLRVQELFCDFRILTPGKTFNLHKTVLVANSQYFRDILDADETKCHVKLKGIKPAAFASVVDYMYSGVLETDPALVPEVCDAADILQLDGLSKWCTETIRANITVETCVDYLKYAEKHSDDSLYDTCVTFLKQNFSWISRGRTFYGLTPHLLAKVVSSDDLKCKSEVEVFTACRRWLDNNPKYLSEDKHDMDEVLENIRFGLIPLKVNKKIINDDVVMSDVNRAKYVNKAIAFQEEGLKRPLLAGTFCKPRSNESMVIFGVPLESQSHHHELKLDLDTFSVVDLEKETISEMDMPIFLSNRHAVSMTTVNNFLFVFGGYTKDVTGSIMVTNQNHRYDPLRDKWINLCPNGTARYGACSFLVGGQIYLVGGCDEQGHAVDSVEKYDIACDTWVQSGVLSKEQGFVDAAVCTLSSKVYVSGGSIHKQHSDAIMVFNEDTQNFEVVGRMTESRSCHAMCTDGNLIYMLGGFGQGGATSSVEVFDPATGKVELLSSMPDTNGHVSGVQHKNNIYIVGGVTESSSKSITTDHNHDKIPTIFGHKSAYSEAAESVWVYDTASRSWHKAPLHLNHPMLHCCATSLVLPHRR